MTTRKICTTCGAAYGPEQKLCPNDGGSLRMESTDDPLIGQVVGERYHVTGLLGEGGMGRVYMAEHVRMGRKSALKVMRPGLAATADAVTRFNREASNASRINHPNVAAVYDFGETSDGLLYIAMEFVEGETLHALVRRAGPLPIARAARIAKGVADALFAAHHMDIIHRDLKPDNIMITRHIDGSDWVKVVDFGIAKSVAAPGQGGSGGQTVTTAGVSLGTPEYMSPEQLAGEQLDARTDIYSLGLVLFNMLTGHLPYPSVTSKETLVRRLTSAPSTLADVRPDVAWPASVQAVLTRALDPEPDRRYGSVADLGRAIVAAADALPAGVDLDATVRVSSLAVPALGATSAHRPAHVGERASSPTRPMAPPRGRGTRRVIAVVVVVLLAAAAGYAWLRVNGTPLRSAPHAAASVSLHAPTTPVVKPPSAAVAPSTARSTSAPTTGAPTTTAPTTAASNSPVTPDFSAALREIHGDVQRAGRLVAQGHPLQANQAMRAGQAAAKALRESAPRGQLPAGTERQLRDLGAQALAACYVAAAGDTGSDQRCRAFQEREARGARGANRPAV